MRQDYQSLTAYHGQSGTTWALPGMSFSISHEGQAFQSDDWEAVLAREVPSGYSFSPSVPDTPGPAVLFDNLSTPTRAPSATVVPSIDVPTSGETRHSILRPLNENKDIRLAREGARHISHPRVIKEGRHSTAAALSERGSSFGDQPGKTPYPHIPHTDDLAEPMRTRSQTSKSAVNYREMDEEGNVVILVSEDDMPETASQFGSAAGSETSDDLEIDPDCSAISDEDIPMVEQSDDEEAMDVEVEGLPGHLRAGTRGHGKKANVDLAIAQAVFVARGMEPAQQPRSRTADEEADTTIIHCDEKATTKPKYGKASKVNLEEASGHAKAKIMTPCYNCGAKREKNTMKAYTYYVIRGGVEYRLASCASCYLHVRSHGRPRSPEKFGQEKPGARRKIAEERKIEKERKKAMSGAKQADRKEKRRKSTRTTKYKKGDAYQERPAY